MARGGMGMMSRERLWLGCRKRRERYTVTYSGLVGCRLSLHAFVYCLEEMDEHLLLSKTFA